MAGDPARHVIGKPEEKPARVHRPQKPKPPKHLAAIHADVKLRMQELEPVIAEFRRLEAAAKALDKV